MCGILGVVGPRPADGILDAALDRLSHRGPDGRGTWSDQHAWLGHRRLSIIDVAHGEQPMRDPETGVVVTYNGEVYNYLELRRELEAAGHRFVTRCDTEVLLRAYLEWGQGCLERFNGMWAFLVWDPRHNRAFLARDRFGVKPLYWALRDGALMLASEPKALVAVDPSLAEVDEVAVRELLANRRAHHSARTFYAHISSLLPGHCATFAPGAPAPQIRVWWQTPTPSAEGVGDSRDVLERFGELFHDAVGLRLRSDVPVGLTLSGGIDSTAILAAMSEALAVDDGKVRAYTAAYETPADTPEIDERRWARLAASAVPNVELWEVSAEIDNWTETLTQITWHMDGPGFSPAVFPMWQIMARARAEGVPVLLEGQGADEQYGGYSHYPALAFLDRSRQALRGAGSPAQVLSAARAGRQARSWPAFLRETVTAMSPAAGAWQRRRSALPQLTAGDARTPGRPRFERRLAEDFAVNLLPPFLHYGDAISMAHSIETRLPFMDYRLVEFAFGLDSEARIGEGESKHILRRYLRGVGQATIADRGYKMGYPTPAYEWMAADNASILRDTVLAPNSHVVDLVGRSKLTGLVERHAAGQRAGGDLLYSLLTTEIWWRNL